MSQAKVDNYKKSKANRQKIMKREKIMHRLEIPFLVLRLLFLNHTTMQPSYLL